MSTVSSSGAVISYDIHGAAVDEQSTGCVATDGDGVVLAITKNTEQAGVGLKHRRDGRDNPLVEGFQVQKGT